MTSDNYPGAGRHSAEKGSTDSVYTETELSQGMLWLRRGLPVVFLVLVTVIAVHELRMLDLHAVRSALQTLSLSQLLNIQLVAISGILVMCLYDWFALRIFNIETGFTTLMRNTWIANTFNNLIGLSGLAGSGIRMLLLGSSHIDTRRAALK